VLSNSVAGLLTLGRAFLPKCVSPPVEVPNRNTIRQPVRAQKHDGAPNAGFSVPELGLQFAPRCGREGGRTAPKDILNEYRCRRL